jgi:hypothetical protein
VTYYYAPLKIAMLITKIKNNFPTCYSQRLLAYELGNPAIISTTHPALPCYSPKI